MRTGVPGLRWWPDGDSPQAALLAVPHDRGDMLRRRARLNAVRWGLKIRPLANANRVFELLSAEGRTEGFGLETHVERLALTNRGSPQIAGRSDDQGL